MEDLRWGHHQCQQDTHHWGCISQKWTQLTLQHQYWMTHQVGQTPQCSFQNNSLLLPLAHLPPLMLLSLSSHLTSSSLRKPEKCKNNTLVVNHNHFNKPSHSIQEPLILFTKFKKQSLAVQSFMIHHICFHNFNLDKNKINCSMNWTNYVYIILERKTKEYCNCKLQHFLVLGLRPRHFRCFPIHWVREL